MLIFFKVRCCSTLQLWVGLSLLNLHLCSFNGYSVDVLLSSFKERNSLINRRMSNIYLKVTTGKNWGSENLNFPNLKNLSLGQFLESSNSLSFKNAPYNFKIRVLKAKESWYFKVKEDMLFVE